MRRFGTEGRLYPEDNYVVSRSEETINFINRIKQGKYIVLFAPRQTGKTTFFRLALEALTAEDPTYFPIQLNFEEYEDYAPADFYAFFYQDIRNEIERIFQKREEVPSDTLTQFLDNAKIVDHVSTRMFFEELGNFLKNQKVVLIIDEFDAIPQAAVKGFLRSLRHIYLSDKTRCPHSVGIVGIKSISQLNYDRSVSPFNIQQEFHLPNFTVEQVRELFAQYTDEVGQAFASQVIVAIHKQTAGQPVLVNRLAQILTEEMDIPTARMITIEHFTAAHARLLHSRNTNIQHLTTAIRKDARFEKILMRITAHDEGIPFNPHDELIDKLVTYGVISKGVDGLCDIANPIYLYAILQAFKPTVNGLEEEYFPEDNLTGFQTYLTDTGQIAVESLLDNFRDFIERAGFRILQVPQTPQESVGRHLLLTYLDQFVQTVGGSMYLEVQTGRGRIDLLIMHSAQKYIVETKIWRGEARYQAGKQQLAAYLKLEGATEGYYVVFDHRRDAKSRVETEALEGNLTIRSYVIPVMQEVPSSNPSPQ